MQIRPPQQQQQVRPQQHPTYPHPGMQQPQQQAAQQQQGHILHPQPQPGVNGLSGVHMGGPQHPESEGFAITRAGSAVQRHYAEHSNV